MDIGTLHPSPHYNSIKYAVRDSNTSIRVYYFACIFRADERKPSRARD